MNSISDHQNATPAIHAEMEAEFKALESRRGDQVEAREALEIARRYPRTAAVAGAISTYVIGYQAKADEHIIAKDPMKAGLGLLLSKPTRFENCDHLTNAYELAFTQTAYDREASLIAMIPYLSTSLQSHFDNGLTRHDFSLLSQVAVWSANAIKVNLVKDVSAIGRALRR